MREEKMRVLIVLPWWLWYFRFPRGLRRRLKIVTSIRVCSFENDFGSFAEGFHISFFVIFFSKEDRSFKKEKKESIIFLALFSLSLLFSFPLSLCLFFLFFPLFLFLFLFLFFFLAQGLNPVFPIPQPKQREPLSEELANRIRVVSSSFREECPSAEIWADARALIGLIAQESSSTNEVSHLQRAVARWVSSLLSKTSFSQDPAANNEARQQASQLFLDVIQLTLKTVGKHPHRLADACNRILSHRFPFYLGYFLVKPEDRKYNALLSKQDEREKARVVESLHAETPD